MRAVLDLCGLAAAAGHQVVLVTYDDRDIPESWAPEVVKIDPPRGPLQRFDGKTLKILQNQLNQTDVLHLHTPWESPNVQVARLARAANRPYILTIHGMLDDYSMAQRGLKKRIYMALWGRRLLEGAFKVHSTAEAELQQAHKWFPKGRGEVIPLVFDLDAYRQLPGPQPARRAFPFLQGDDPVVLFLSRLHYKKGVELLIDAVAALRQRGRPVQLVITGTGEDAYVETLKARAQERGLADVAHFTGLVVGSEKVSLYETADVFALPTSQENLGYVLPEALAATTPVITTKGVDIWPELEASGGALIIKQTAEALTDAIETLLADPDRRQAMGASGRQWVFQAFDADTLMRRYIDLYEEAIDALG